MFNLVEYKKIKTDNPNYSLIAIDLINGRYKNPLEDIRKGKATKENVVKLLDLSKKFGWVEDDFYYSFQKKLMEIA